MRVRISADAVEDMASIWDFTCREWSVEQADLYAESLKLRFAWLTVNQGLWIARPELGSSVFTYPHHSHLVVFRTIESQIEILRVLHQKMDSPVHIT